MSGVTPGLPFGELLKRYRVAAGWTQEALAERARLSPRTISDLERGVTNWPYKDTVALLATALALTPEQRAALEATRRRPTLLPDARQSNGSASPVAVGSLNPADGTTAPLSHLRTFLIGEWRESAWFGRERDEASAAELAARFEALVREGVAARDGQVIESRGNEVVVAFGSARQALRAALDLQERAARANADESAWPLPMCIGLDAGEAVPAEGGYRGGALNLAARLCGMAAPGEVLISVGVMYLARRMPGLTYVERGELAADGVDDPVRVIQVLAEKGEGVNSGEGEAGLIAPDIAVAWQSSGEQRAARINALYRAAQAAMAVENWADALEQLRVLLTLDPGHAEATRLTRRALQQQELPALYDKGRAHYDAGRWRAALDYFRQAQQIGGNYKGIFALMATAQYEIEREGARVNGGIPHGSPRAGATQTGDPIDAHYIQVVKAFMDGRVVPFLGADINLCGRPADMPWRQGQSLPTNGELAAYLAESFGYQWRETSDLVRVSQYVSVMTGISPLYTALRELYDSDYPPTPVHQFLATLPGALHGGGHPARYQLIVTTAYDDVLERAFMAAGEPYDLVSYVAEGEQRGTFIHYPPDDEPRPIERPNEYRALSLDRRTVILKMHGAVDRQDPERDSFVITEDNYINYLTRIDISNLMPVTLLARLRASHVLFLGYSLREWSQRVIVHRLWGERKLSDKYRCWALQASADPIDREFWNKRDVTILPVSLDEYIAALSARVQAIARVGIET